VHEIKTKGHLFGETYFNNVKRNIEKHQWARDYLDKAVKNAAYWRGKPYDEIWDIPFSPTLMRSHHVLSDGDCPICKQSVPMYEWIINPFKHPWKVQCPYCDELFPKNDFYAYYLSGLDSKRMFRYDLADETLLVPDGIPTEDTEREKDRINHPYGDIPGPTSYDYVDDGSGYDPHPWDGNRRYRFIGAYLNYGQWHDLTVGGVKALACAYMLTGDMEYARRGIILLDRIADTFPYFDFHRDGYLYEIQGACGYATTWHDSNEEVFTLTYAYDILFDSMEKDANALTGFLSAKAGELGLENDKKTIADIRRNIETRIFTDVLNNPKKIHSNYPRMHMLLLLIHLVLDPENGRDTIERIAGDILENAVKVDGVTGEKGLGGYSNSTVFSIYKVLQTVGLYDPSWLENLINTHPSLSKTIYFFTDLWFLDKYTPFVGDHGWVGATDDFYAGFEFAPINPGLCLNTFFWRMYLMTRELNYLKVVYRKVERDINAIKADIGMADYDDMYAEIYRLESLNKLVIRRTSVIKRDWKIGALSSGEGADERSVWMHFCTNEHRGHSHFDTMNIGIYAKGVDLMNDFGYPPVQYGGWATPYARWYYQPAAHNTVEVDGRGGPGAGYRIEYGNVSCAELFGEAPPIRVFGANADGYAGTKRFNRRIAMVDISGADSYIIDVFIVEGGNEHAKFTHSSFGQLTYGGLTAEPCMDYPHADNGILTNGRGQEQTVPGWYIDWEFEDRWKALSNNKKIHLRLHELTDNASAAVYSAWVNAGGGYDKQVDGTLETALCRRTGHDLNSVFVSVLEPYENAPFIKSKKRIYVDEPSAAVEISLSNGLRDVVFFSDTETISIALPEGVLRSNAKAGLIRFENHDAKCYLIGNNTYASLNGKPLAN